MPVVWFLVIICFIDFEVYAICFWSNTEERMPHVLRVETEREKELSQQLDKVKKELDDLKKRCIPQFEREMQRRDSTFCFFCFSIRLKQTPP